MDVQLSIRDYPFSGGRFVRVWDPRTLTTGIHAQPLHKLAMMCPEASVA